jgi:Secretin and TonB N terminus short domain.
MEFSTRGGQGIPARPTNLFSRQKWLAMRLMLTLLFTSLLQAQAHNGWSQNTVTLSFRNALLPEVFKAVQKQTGYSFAYERSVMQQAKRVSIAVINVPLREALDSLFREQTIGYEIEGKLIILYEGKGVHKDADTVKHATIDVVGVVADENGMPMQGVNVVVKGTKIGTYTDIYGKFLLKKIHHDAILIITSVGYDKVEISVKEKGIIHVQMNIAVKSLDELQVIAYGVTSQRYNLGNVATVKSSEIEKQPISTLSNS